MSSGNAARRLHGIDMQQPAVRDARFRPPARTGWITPVSLLASHQRDQHALAAERFARRRSRRRDRPRHARSTGIFSTALGAKRPPASTEGCSIADTSSRSNGRLPPPPQDAGVSASAFASVPPEVKMTLRASAPTSAATALARLFDQICARPRALRHGPRTGCRSASSAADSAVARLAATAHSHSSPDRYARPLIPRYRRRVHIQPHYPKDLLLAPGIVLEQPRRAAAPLSGSPLARLSQNLEQF